MSATNCIHMAFYLQSRIAIKWRTVKSGPQWSTKSRWENLWVHQILLNHKQLMVTTTKQSGTTVEGGKKEGEARALHEEKWGPLEGSVSHP